MKDVTIKVSHKVDNDLLIKTVAYMIYYGMPRKGKLTAKKVRDELAELLFDRGIIGTKELLEQERFKGITKQAQETFKLIK